MDSAQEFDPSKISSDDRAVVQKLFPEIAEFHDPALGETVADLWVYFWRQSRWENLESVPYLIETPEISLVTHIRFVAQGSLALGDLCKDLLNWPIDRDLLLAAALLHDASKPMEYQPTEHGYAKTEIGQKLTHAVYATAICLQQKLPFDLVHLIHSHTPMAAVEPKRVEGWILRAVDNAMAEGRLGMSLSRYLESYNR